MKRSEHKSLREFIPDLRHGDASNPGLHQILVYRKLFRQLENALADFA